MSTKTNTTSSESQTGTTEDDVEIEESVVETSVDPEPESEELEDTDGTHSEPDVGDEEQENESSAEASPEQTDGTEEDDIEEAETESEIEEETISGPPSQFQTALKGGVIRDFVSTLRAIVDEAKLTVTPDGITTRAVDPANVAMYDVQLRSGAFESYDASEGLLGINLERLDEVLKLAKKNDLVQMTFDTSTFKLIIHIDGVEFSMACIDPDSIRPEPDIPEMDLPISFTLDERQVSRGVKAADMVSDHIRFRCDETNDTVHIEAEGDTDDVSLELTKDDLESITPAEGTALYSLDYVKDLSREFPKNDELSLTFGQEFPMMIEYGLADGECEVLAMLAPRIET